MCQAQLPHKRDRNLTVEEVMAEPIVRELMRADHVDPAVFEALLRSVAAPAPPNCQVPSDGGLLGLPFLHEYWL